MRYMVELMEHNGCNGANRVEPFGGEVVPIEDKLSEHVLKLPINRFNRIFTYSHTIRLPEQINYLFREKVVGEPSEWALANA